MSSPAPAGARLFARYAYAPNELGYCGPADAAALLELGATGRADADIPAIARRFSGAWPYLRLLSELAGIRDPLDEQVVRAYWTGGPLLHQVDRARFGAALLEAIGPQAGPHWAHLTPDLLHEAAPTHGFHVLGVYPWSRLLAGGAAEAPLRVLEGCLIRWGRLLALDGEHAIVRSRALTWDGRRLGLSPARRERVRIHLDGLTFVPGAAPGQWLALHWDWACERLLPVEVARLRHWTCWQLRATNRRLAAGEDPRR